MPCRRRFPPAPIGDYRTFSGAHGRNFAADDRFFRSDVPFSRFGANFRPSGKFSRGSGLRTHPAHTLPANPPRPGGEILKIRGVLLILVLAGAPAPGRPADRSRFWDSDRIRSFAALEAAVSADIVTSDAALRVPGAREGNPLAQTTAGTVALKISCCAAIVGASYLAHATGHDRISRILPKVAILPSAFAAGHNFKFAASGR